MKRPYNISIRKDKGRTEKHGVFAMNEVVNVGDIVEGCKVRPDGDAAYLSCSCSRADEHTP